MGNIYFYLKKLPKENSEHKLFEKIERIYDGKTSNRMAYRGSDFETCSYETTSFHCTNTGPCSATGKCDQCSLCVSTSITFQPCASGSGSGGSGSNDTGNPGYGGGPSDPYIYSPNNYDNPVFDDPIFLNSLNTQLFLNNLDYDKKLWVQNNPEIQNQVIQFLIQNNWSDESKIFAKEIIDASRLLDINAMEVWDDYSNFLGQMSTSERSIFDGLSSNRKLWYMVSAKKAFDKANELFPNSTYNGKGDAFRHVLWNGYCALTIAGNIGEQLTTAHEVRPSIYPFNYKETEMDLYNNEKGRQIAITSNLSNIVDNILNDLNNGYLRYLNNLNQSIDPNFRNRATYNSVLIPTDQ